jgi:hypothetical protein
MKRSAAAHLPDMSTNQPRVAGAGAANGQYAVAPLGESASGLHAPTANQELLGLAERAFPSMEEAPYVEAITRVEAQRSARAVLASLSDEQFFNEHWFGIESAAMQYQRFSGDTDGEEAAAASPADTLGVDLYDYMSINEPDRPGETGYVGYDFAGFAEKVSDEWRATLTSRVNAAVLANEAATTLAARATAA